MTEGPGRDRALDCYAAVLGQEGEVSPPQAAEAAALLQLISECGPEVPVAVLRHRLGSLRVAAASRVRAMATAAAGLRQGGGPVEVLARRHPHLGFFALEELELTHPRFDGCQSARLVREVFVSGMR